MKTVISFFLLLLATQGYSCTIFSLTDGVKMLIGNNEDYSYSEDYFMRVTRPGNGSYGRLTFVTKVYFFLEVVQGGMNDQGLFVDGATTPVDSGENKPSDHKFRRTANYNFVNELLATCRNVNEALGYLNETKFDKPAFHLLLADKGGRSVIVEWIEGAMIVVPSTERCQVATNHILSGPVSPSSQDLVRDNLVERHVERRPSVTIENVASILVEAMQVGDTGGTLYSNIYDLDSQSMTMFLRGKRSTMKWFRLGELVAKGNSIQNVKDLF